MRKKRLSLYKAKTANQVQSISETWSPPPWKDGELHVNGTTIRIHAGGKFVDMPKRSFDKMIAWYIKPQSRW